MKSARSDYNNDRHSTDHRAEENPLSFSAIGSTLGDQYLDFVRSLWRGFVIAFKSLFEMSGTSFDSFMESVTTVLAVPIAIGNVIYQIVAWCVYILTTPLRLCHAFASTFPILSLVLILFLFSAVYAFRRLTALRFVDYFLYTVLPYIGAFLYTAVTFFFPQVNSVKRVLEVLAHPIRWILGMANTVDDRAEHIRNAVDLFSPSSESAARRRHVSRLLCSKCLKNDKTCLLQPCNHFCLCIPCYEKMSKTGKLACPVCVSPINSYIKVDL